MPTHSHARWKLKYDEPAVSEPSSPELVRRCHCLYISQSIIIKVSDFIFLECPKAAGFEIGETSWLPDPTTLVPAFSHP